MAKTVDVIVLIIIFSIIAIWIYWKAKEPIDRFFQWIKLKIAGNRNGEGGTHERTIEYD